MYPKINDWVRHPIKKIMYTHNLECTYSCSISRSSVLLQLQFFNSHSTAVIVQQNIQPAKPVFFAQALSCFAWLHIMCWGLQKWVLYTYRPWGHLLSSTIATLDLILYILKKFPEHIYYLFQVTDLPIDGFLVL